MGVALGFAATQAPPIALLVFGALGIGFAAPFVALTFMPRLLRALPRPGPWMVRLREALAFPMFATAIWLIWVVSAQAGQSGVLAGLTGVFAASLSVWLARTWPGNFANAAAIAILVAALTWAGFHVSETETQTENAQTNQSQDQWSEARVRALQAQGKTVFVNFTADWCVTCKVNEVSVFSDARVKAAFDGDKVVYLIADWTKRDANIARALASHGRVGVPLYLVYKPDIANPTILPQILSPQTVLNAIN
jgi:thiol:disulfide interchange protein